MMSSSAHIILAFGYCRAIKGTFMDIPKQIMLLIAVYNTKYMILGIGKNRFGELSVDTKKAVYTWTNINDLENVIPSYHNIYLNCYGLFIIDVQNQLYAAGHNPYDRFGVFNKYSKQNMAIFKLEHISFDKLPALVSRGVANRNHILCYTINGELYANGLNDNGQCGSDDLCLSSKSIFHKIPRFWNIYEDIKRIQCGSSHTLFLTTNGNVFACGMNRDQRCSVNNTNLKIYPPELVYTNIKDIAVGSEHNVLIDCNNDLIMYGGSGIGKNEFAEPICKYFRKNKIKMRNISCGADHVLVLSVDGKCYSFGQNTYGQCGVGYILDYYEGLIHIPYLLNLKDEVCQISCGYDHSLVLTEKNEVYSFGDNAHHQCSALDGVKNILSPKYLDKEQEFNIDSKAYIDTILGFTEDSLIIINPNKNARFCN